MNEPRFALVGDSLATCIFDRIGPDLVTFWDSFRPAGPRAVACDQVGQEILDLPGFFPGNAVNGFETNLSGSYFSAFHQQLARVVAGGCMLPGLPAAPAGHWSMTARLIQDKFNAFPDGRDRAMRAVFANTWGHVELNCQTDSRASTRTATVPGVFPIPACLGEFEPILKPGILPIDLDPRISALDHGVPAIIAAIPEPPHASPPDNWARVLFLFLWTWNSGALTPEQERLIRCWVSVLPADNPLRVDALEPWGTLMDVLQRINEFLTTLPPIHVIRTQADIDALGLGPDDLWRAEYGFMQPTYLATHSPCCVYVYGDRFDAEVAAEVAAGLGDAPDLSAGLMAAILLHEMIHMALGDADPLTVDPPPMPGDPPMDRPEMFVIEGLLDDILGIENPARDRVLAAAGFPDGVDPADPASCP
jgi:hypothetical protein